jgi:hypothetical protein
MTLIYNSTKAIIVLPVGARFHTPEQTFVGTQAQISDKLRELNLAPPAGFEMTEPQQEAT